MAVCAVCDVPVAEGRTVQGACPECQSLYSVVDEWYENLMTSMPQEGEVQTHFAAGIRVLKRRLGRFFELHQAPKPMQWG